MASPMDSVLLFVHGTGVRGQSYEVTLDQVRAKVKQFELPCTVQECLWGDVLGIDFAGLSIPDMPKRTEAEQAQAYRWEYLQIDPLFDLKLWCTPAVETPAKRLGETPKAQFLWTDRIEKYTPGIELDALLDREEVKPFFAPAWKAVVATGLPQKAFAGAGNEDASVARVFAEAVVAQMMHDASQASPPVAIPPHMGGKIVDRLLYDWKQISLAVLKDLFLKFFGGVTKTVVRPMRAGASRAVAPAIGDILRYQAVGEQIRALIRKKIDAISGDVFVLSHSLGGIACFEIMVESRPAHVKGLITAGSQAPLLHEFGALQTLKEGALLPEKFLPWLNLYDENDLLSYRADRLFHCAVDKRVDSMLPPLEAHSAYWKLDDTWTAIRDFMKNNP